MKREKFLWPLTQSHHRALLTARKVKEVLSLSGGQGAAGRIRDVSAEIEKLFEEELHLHFWDEEKILVLYEEHMGREEPEPQRIRREHRLLEKKAASPDRESLLFFADLLTAHVRFEEDVFFGRMEKVFTESEKQFVAKLLEMEAALNRPKFS